MRLELGLARERAALDLPDRVLHRVGHEDPGGPVVIRIFEEQRAGQEVDHQLRAIPLSRLLLGDERLPPLRVSRSIRLPESDGEPATSVSITAAAATVALFRFTNLRSR